LLGAVVKLRRKRARQVARFTDFNDHMLADIGIIRDCVPAAVRRSSSYP
jgi:uncharacterized protein YjiS (DUF1127 family)